MEIDPDLLRARMMRGALTGPAEKEKEPVKYCKGVKKDGKKCKTTVLYGEKFCKECKNEMELAATGERVADDGKLAEPQISPVAPDPTQEHTNPCAKDGSALLRLLTVAVPPPAPLPPCSLVVTLDAYRYQQLIEAEITPDDIAMLITYLLDGELQRVNRATA